mmetsp:Transcript_38595/g.43467  ORF Transcript_38595/g.43467 Transcript_38595/m.43467 type:complete len:108 (-) Transcript_38595:80-403(-)
MMTMEKEHYPYHGMSSSCDTSNEAHSKDVGVPGCVNHQYYCTHSSTDPAMHTTWRLVRRHPERCHIGTIFTPRTTQFRLAHIDHHVHSDDSDCCQWENYGAWAFASK